MPTPCIEQTCCPDSDFLHASVDADNCPDGYVWNGEECVPDDCVVETTSLPDGDVGVSYMETLVAEGFLGMFDWTIIGGSLPDGLALVGDTIQGTPTAGGTFTFIVEAEPHL